MAPSTRPSVVRSRTACDFWPGPPCYADRGPCRASPLHAAAARSLRAMSPRAYPRRKWRPARVSLWARLRCVILWPAWRSQAGGDAPGLAPQGRARRWPFPARKGGPGRSSYSCIPPPGVCFERSQSERRAPELDRRGAPCPGARLCLERRRDGLEGGPKLGFGLGGRPDVQTEFAHSIN